MYYREISKCLGFYLLGFSLLFLIPFFVSLYYQFLGEPGFALTGKVSAAFFQSMLLTFLLGACFWMGGIDAKGTLYRREADY